LVGLIPHVLDSLLLLLPLLGLQPVRNLILLELVGPWKHLLGLLKEWHQRRRGPNRHGAAIDAWLTGRWRARCRLPAATYRRP
jgi:hypothetical protein